MFCRNCGNQVADNAAFCPVCNNNLQGTGDSSAGQQQYQQQYQQPYQQQYQQQYQQPYQQQYQQPYQQQSFVGAAPKNYLVESILVTLCCCLPFGIVAIIYASKVSNLVAQGDLNGAYDAAKQAKMWCCIGLGVGIVVNCLSVLIQVCAGVLSEM